MSRLKISKGATACFVSLIFLNAPVFAQASCSDPAGRFASIEGKVEVRTNDQQNWRSAKPSEQLCQGDTIRVGEIGRAAVVLVNEAVMRLDKNTTMRLLDVSGKKEKRSWIEVLGGTIKSFIRKPKLLSVNTPYINGSVEGTEFQVSVEDDRASILVLEGRVLASNEHGKVSVTPSMVAEAKAGMAPAARTLVKPRDAVQWTLHYPPILAAPKGGGPSLESAMQYASHGDYKAAFDVINSVPESDRNAQYFSYRAALQLGMGQHNQARADIDAALNRDANYGLAYALRAIIHVVRNEREPALTNAEKAVALSDTSATRIALSYAQQASFRIDAARDTLLAAVNKQADDPLAWARLGELHLMLGERDKSRAAAAKAASLAPNLARAQLVLGFAELAEYRDAAARTTFQRAVELDSSDPLAHLGLGLAQVSAGNIAAGREELEVAVALDSSQSILRAYLGKAYFEEKRSPLDDQQFGIAKSLDPLDPTAFLYDGIRKQTENRPVEALEDFRQSVALNDNRAVYRSRLLLDKDEAARGTSLARVYNDLGFTELGVAEATRSLTTDPANASAHRFLADVYQGTRRREIARVSELTQAQMLQDLNLNPIQLSASEANLNIVTAGGPASAGFNEFTPLFQRNQTQFSIAGLAGNNDTQGLEAALSGVYDRLSFSLGALTYDTDGWRPNNGLKQDLYNVFVQAALTDTLNVQAEFRHRESTEGDLAFNFDPADYHADSTRTREQDTARLGFRFSPTPQSHFLVSYVHSERKEKLDEFTDATPFFTFTDRNGYQVDADQVEFQYLNQGSRANLVAGAAYGVSKRRDDTNVNFVDLDLGDGDDSFAIIDSYEYKNRQPRAYVYVTPKTTGAVTWTLGASYDRYEDDTLTENSFNPKLGVQWDIADNLRLRAAALQVLKPDLINNRTLEPTQVAGFNQLFDDINGTKSRLYGGGLDWKPHRNLAAGWESTWRTLDEPLFDFINGAWIVEERQEQLHRLHLYWTPGERFAARTELIYDRYTSDSGIATEFDSLPLKVRTVSLPVNLSYFSPSGLFGGVTLTYVDQKVERFEFASGASGQDSFVVTDLALGYRLGKRRGIVSLAVKNLFDTKFNYQDDSYREFRDEPSTGPYFPERTVMARFALSF